MDGLPKDVILKVGWNSYRKRWNREYSGIFWRNYPKSLSCTGKGTICNMGLNIGKQNLLLDMTKVWKDTSDLQTEMMY